MRWRGESGRMKTRRQRLVLVPMAGPVRSSAVRTIGRALVVVVTIFVATVCVVASEGRGVGETTPSGQLLLPGPGILVAGDGAAETYAYCIACHSERLVAQQGLTWQGWEEVIELMMEEHGMAPIESPNLERVLRYLSTHYGPDRPNFPLQ